jgi:ATP-binding cassette subfamily B protein
MTTAEDVELDEEDRSRRPSKAVVGSHREDEEVFGKAIDPKVIRRIWTFVHPYRKQIYISVVAVLAFTFTQLAS